MSETGTESRFFRAFIFTGVAVAVCCCGILVAAAVTLKSYYIPSSSMAPTLVINDHLMVNTVTYDFREPRRGEVLVFAAPKTASVDGKEHEFIKRVVAVPDDVVRITAGYVQVGEERFDHSILRAFLSNRDEGDHQDFVKLSDRGVLLNGEAVSREDLETALGVKPGTPITVVPGRIVLNGKYLDELYVAEDPDSDYPILSSDSRGEYRTPKEWLTNVDGKTAVRIPEGRLLVMGDNRNNANDSRFWGLLERERVTAKAWFVFRPWDRRGVIK